MSLAFKLHFLFLTPLSLLSSINGVMLYLAESYVLLSINILVFVLIVTISLPFLGSFSDRLTKGLKDLSADVETVKYSAQILSNESITHSTAEIEAVYADIKHVMVSCLHKKDHLSIAKDLGRICNDLGPITMKLQEHYTHNENLSYFTSDCIVKKSDRMTSQIYALGIKPEKKKYKKLSKPSLRRALAFRSFAHE